MAKKNEEKLDLPKVDVVNAPQEPTTGVMAKATHRYFCEACTGTAFVTNDVKEGKHPSVCKNCGAPVIVKPENFIAL